MTGRVLERKLVSLRISALEEEIKRLNDTVKVLTKIHSDFERGDCVIHSDFEREDRVRLSDDDADSRKLKVTRVRPILWEVR